jgi:predicted anti-sigma-YlaC factor YlaD
MWQRNVPELIFVATITALFYVLLLIAFDYGGAVMLAGTAVVVIGLLLVGWIKVSAGESEVLQEATAFMTAVAVVLLLDALLALPTWAELGVLIGGGGLIYWLLPVAYRRLGSR